MKANSTLSGGGVIMNMPYMPNGVSPNHKSRQIQGGVMLSTAHGTTKSDGS